MAVRNKLARTLTQGRENRRLTQHELAQRVGVSARSVMAWETGEHVPQNGKLRLVAAELGLNLEELRAQRWDAKISRQRRRARERKAKESSVGAAA